MAYITRTPEEIAEVVEKLTAIKESLPEKNHFGDNNHAKYDAMIDVVKGRLTADDIGRMEGNEEDEDDFFEGSLDEIAISDLYMLEDWLHNSSVDINNIIEL